MAIDVSMSKLQDTIKKLDATKEQTKKAIKATLSDIQSRVSGLVSTEVTNVYGIKKSDVTDKLKNGNMAVNGNIVDGLRLDFSSNLLTPVRFGMKPKAHPRGKNYRITAAIKKGKTKTIGFYDKKRTPDAKYSKQSPYFLGHTGNTKEGGVNYIAFRREGRGKGKLKKFMTVSVPQMIDNKGVRPQVETKIADMVGKRLDHHMKRLVK